MPSAGTTTRVALAAPDAEGVGGVVGVAVAIGSALGDGGRAVGNGVPGAGLGEGADVTIAAGLLGAGLGAGACSHPATAMTTTTATVPARRANKLERRAVLMAPAS
jgi:hypothetical protein